jgi:(2R)-phospho-3-sulfolactate synthase (ComA)
MKPARKAFDFVKISDMPPKPRNTGVIEIRGPYYTPTTIGYVKGLLEMCGDYIDGFKFAGGSMRLLSVDIFEKYYTGKTCPRHTQRFRNFICFIRIKIVAGSVGFGPTTF